MPPSGPVELRPWNSLDPGEQLALRQNYQLELATRPLTCSMDEKMARFSAWLAQRGVNFTSDDLPGRKTR